MKANNNHIDQLYQKRFFHPSSHEELKNWEPARRTLDDYFVQKRKKRIVITLALVIPLIILGGMWSFSDENASYTLNKTYQFSSPSFPGKLPTNNIDTATEYWSTEGNVLNETSDEIVSIELTPDMAPFYSTKENIDNSYKAPYNQLISKNKKPKVKMQKMTFPELSSYSFISLVPKTYNIKSIAIPFSSLTVPSSISPDIKKPVCISLDIYKGLHLNQKEITSDIPKYNSRRTLEEKSIITSSIGTKIVIDKENLEYTAGIELFTLGERTNYQSSSMKDSLIDMSHWQLTQSQWLVIDTFFNYGVRYFDSTEFTTTDSVYHQQTDTISVEASNPRISKYNGRNVHYYVQVPLSIGYVYRTSRLDYRLNLGGAIGFLMLSKGYYLDKSLERLSNLNDENILNPVVFSYRVSVAIDFKVTPITKLYLQSYVGGNLNSVFSKEYKVDQKYMNYGVNVGLRFCLSCK